jgi:hypothetical protein
LAELADTKRGNPISLLLGVAAEGADRLLANRLLSEVMVNSSWPIKHRGKKCKRRTNIYKYSLPHLHAWHMLCSSSRPCQEQLSHPWSLVEVPSCTDARMLALTPYTVALSMWVSRHKPIPINTSLVKPS